VSDSKLAPENTTKKETGITSQRLNLILAICAILISAASFYATYLQASAAEKQVKAMTLPLIQFSTGNYVETSKETIITLTLHNAGVGPALIKDLKFKYKNKEYRYIETLLAACCEKEYQQYKKSIKNSEDIKIDDGGYSTQVVLNTIIPGQKEVKFYQLYPGERSNVLWHKFNNERLLLQMKVCYCSLLDNCYLTEKNGVVESVQSCPAQ